MLAFANPPRGAASGPGPRVGFARATPCRGRGQVRLQTPVFRWMPARAGVIVPRPTRTSVCRTFGFGAGVLDGPRVVRSGLFGR